MTPTPAARIRPPDLGFVLVPRVLQFVAVDADGDGALAQLGQLELLELVRVHILGVLGLRCRYDAVGENLACGALTLRHARSFPVRNCNCDGALYFYVPAVLSYIPWSYSARIASALWLVIVSKLSE